MSLIADIFGKLRTPKNVVRKACFGGPFEKQHGKWVQALLKSQPDCLYHIYWSLWKQLIREKSLLVTCKILRLVVNTFTADEKYSPLNRDNLGQPIHMQLSQKQKTFSRIFFKFLKSILHLEHFLKKDYPHRWCVAQIMDSR